jgi:hypothetical protein
VRIDMPTNAENLTDLQRTLYTLCYVINGVMDDNYIVHYDSETGEIRAEPAKRVEE